ncbi:MAG: glycoside hydrolase family 2 TIM barrel-domain containing protein [Chloroherpetonaceae bacterium]
MISKILNFTLDVKKADIVFILLFIFSPISLFAQPVFYENRTIDATDAVSLTRSLSRKVQSLTGKWTASFSNGKVQEIYVPSATNFQGVIKFEKTFRLEKSEEANVFELQSDGIGGACNVLINDQFVALHLGSFVPFSVDIAPEYLRFGAENKITIEVDTRLDVKNTVPLKAQAFEPEFFGGLVRNLALVSKAPIHIDDVDFNYQIASDNTLELTLQTRCKTSNLRNYSIPSDSTGTRVATLKFTLAKDSLVVASGIISEFVPESDKFITSEKKISVPNLSRWSPKSPTRYMLTLSLLAPNGEILDDISFQTGFRTLEAKDGAIVLNGEAIELKGVHIIEDNPETACAISNKEIEADFALLQSLGANAIYFSQIPNPLWQQYADSLGVLMLVNLPFRYAPTPLLLKTKILENADALLRETISATKFSPSVIGYGFGAGLNVSSPNLDIYLERLYALAKKQSRALTFFSPKSFAPSDCYRYCDFLAANALNLSVSEFESYLKDARALKKPVVITSYGVYAEPNNHNGYSDEHSLEYQAKFLMDSFKMFERLNESGRWIAGSFVEALCDYRLSFAPILNAENPEPHVATAGLVTFSREKKLSFEVVKLLYAGERVYNPPIGKADAEFSPFLILSSVLLVVAFVYVLNSNKRLRDSFPRALLRPFNLFVDIRDSRIYIPMDTILLLTLLSLTWSTTLSAILYVGRETFLLDFWLTHIISHRELKQYLNLLVLNPSLAVPILAVFFLILSLLVAAFAQLWLFIIRNHRARYAQLLNVWTWSCAHWFVMLALAIFIERMESEAFVYGVILTSFAFLAFTILRFLMGVATIAELNRYSTYFFGFPILVVFLGGLFALYNNALQTFAYFQYWHILK